MAKIVKLLVDVYPFGCKGDVVGLTDSQLGELDKLAKKREIQKAYNVPAAKAKDDGGDREKKEPAVKKSE